MKELLELVSVNTYLAIFAVGVVFVVLLVLVVAFAQGREVSFWPPKVGAKATRQPKIGPSSDEPVSTPDAQRTTAAPGEAASLHNLNIEIESLKRVEGPVFVFIKTLRDAFHKPHGHTDDRGILVTSTELHWTPEKESQAISISAEWESFISGSASPVKYVSYHTVEVGRTGELHITLPIWSNAREAQS